MDINLDGIKEMVVGSEDFDIRIFKGDDLVGEISENDVSIELFPLSIKTCKQNFHPQK